MTEHALVYVVDDDVAVREAMQLLLDSAGLACEAFDSAAAFLENHNPERSSCLVSDIRMPGMNGLELQQELNRRGSMIPVIFITGHGDVPMAVDAIKSGALDFIQKPFHDDVLIDRIEKALEHDRRQRSERLQVNAIRERIDTLTPREAEVMQCIVQGKANKVIAADLGLSRRTVELHRSRVMRKLGVRSIAELVSAVNRAVPDQTPAVPER